MGLTSPVLDRRTQDKEANPPQDPSQLISRSMFCCVERSGMSLNWSALWRCQARYKMRPTEAVLLLLLQCLDPHLEHILPGARAPSWSACLLDGIELLIILVDESDIMSEIQHRWKAKRGSHWLMAFWILSSSKGPFSFSRAALWK